MGYGGDICSPIPMAAAASRFRAYLPQAPSPSGRVWLLLLAILFVQSQLPGNAASKQSRTVHKAAVAHAPAVLTRVADVHLLSFSDASRHLPLRLRGVVTTVSGWKDSFFLQDRTGGIAVDREEHSEVHSGDVVEVAGVSEPGHFAASVDAHHVRVLGRGQEPAAHLYSYAEMVGGSQDAQWVGIRGIVESADVETIWNHQVLVLNVESGGGFISVRVIHYEPGDEKRLADALVRIEGVCGTVYNDKRQFTGLRLFVPNARGIKILEPGPSDAYALPLSPIRSVLQFGPGSRAGHRVKIAGTVTYQDPGRSMYVQNGDDGMLVATSQKTKVEPGTRVEVVGFPNLSSSSYSPGLSNADFRVTGVGAPVPPVVVHAKDFLQYADNFVYAPYDGQVVRLSGELVEMIPRLRDDVWLLRDGTNHFNAVLERTPGVAAPVFSNGSVLTVTGVFSVQVDENRKPLNLSVLLRNPADLVVTEKASWWTTAHALQILASVLIVTMGTLLWSILLRRRVQEQTRMLRESEERFRQQAQHDMLTGLASRSFLTERLSEALERSNRSGSRIGILMIDLDHFKQVNDTLGHHAGDELLRVVADRIRQSVRKSDLVARMGGDEFVVLLNDIRDSAEAELIGAKVVANVSAPAEIAAHPMPVSASVGVCMHPEGGRDADTLLQNVDAAMYKAKAAGRNSFCVFR
jgi:diguanylate cyclase (GGDEF)-like protein